MASTNLKVRIKIIVLVIYKIEVCIFENPPSICSSHKNDIRLEV